MVRPLAGGLDTSPDARARVGRSGPSDRDAFPARSATPDRRSRVGLVGGGRIGRTGGRTSLASSGWYKAGGSGGRTLVRAARWHGACAVHSLSALADVLERRRFSGSLPTELLTSEYADGRGFLFEGCCKPMTAGPSCRWDEAEMTMSPLRFLKAQPRFFTSALAGALIWSFLPHDWRRSTRLLVAWDCATGLYLILAT